MAEEKKAAPKVEWFKNKATGAVWELTEGTAAYAAAKENPKEFEKVEAPKKAEAAK